MGKKFQNATFLSSNKETGIYECKACGNEIFHSSAKYDSGCGWPSFTEPVRPEAIELKMDQSHFMVREEILCAKCGGHLGHRFPDGPKDKGGIRYCINSVSLGFKGGVIFFFFSRTCRIVNSFNKN